MVVRSSFFLYTAATTRMFPKKEEIKIRVSTGMRMSFARDRLKAEQSEVVELLATFGFTLVS